MRITLKSRLLFNDPIFSYDIPNNTLVRTVERAIKLDIPLKDVDLSNSHLSGGDFRGGDFSGADFYQSILVGVNFSCCILSGADFRLATLNKSNFANTLLERSIFQGTRFTHVTGNGKEIISLTVDGVDVVVTKKEICIGRHQYNICDIKTLSKEVVSELDFKYRDFIKKWHETIFKIIELSFPG